MRLKRRKGNRGKGDKKYIIEQEDGRNDGINIIENCILANQIILNEIRINKEKIERYGNFLFTNAIIDAVNMACLGIDVWNNDMLLRQFCERHWLSPLTIPEMIDEEEQNENI